MRATLASDAAHVLAAITVIRTALAIRLFPRRETSVMPRGISLLRRGSTRKLQ